MGKIISIANQKGGVAKTTSTHNLGTALAKKGKKTLIVDLDSQASLTISVGLEPLEIENNITSILQKNKNKIDINNCITHLKENLDIITSIIDLAQLEIEMLSRPSREKILDRALEPIKDKYDFILIDCPPQLNILTINALSCSDFVIIPVKTDYLSYRGLTQLQDTISEIKELINPKLEILGIITTFFEKNVKDDREILEQLEKEYNVIGIIKKQVAAKKGIYKGLSAVEQSKTKNISIEYNKVADLIIKRSI